MTNQPLKPPSKGKIDVIGALVTVYNTPVVGKQAALKILAGTGRDGWVWKTKDTGSVIQRALGL